MDNDIQSAQPGSEIQCAKIRIRAERKAGQLLTGMEKNKGGRPNGENRSNDTTSLADMGVSKDQSSQWQKLAGAG